ncbi:MAG: hypothetical protein ABIL58_12385 [Pseudomonadota bacterium]
MNEYPHECTRCGMCCIAETCPIGMKAFGIGLHDRCPAFSYDFYRQPLAHSTCAIASRITGVGAGCCIKARAIKAGVTYDFAALQPAVKLLLALDAYDKKIYGD